MTLLLFIVILSILVFVHELGHFLAAKSAGMLVEEFGFGLPPRVWGKKIGETIYSINALPIGGFVKLYGEDGDNQVQSSKCSPPMAGSRPKAGKVQSYGRAYYEKSIPRRLSVLLAGVVMNLILAIVSFSVLYFVLGIPTKTGKIKIVGITKDSPAQLAELKENDEIIGVDGQTISSTEQFVKGTKEKAGNKIQLEIKRGEENLIISLISRQSPPEGEGALGVVISDSELKKYPWWQMPYLGAREGFKDSLSWGKMIFGALKNTLVSLITMGKIPKDIAGPIGIFQITGQVAKDGILAVLQFLGILSVNLAIINILPFPALDGGRLIFLGVEAVSRKKVSPKIEILVNQIGMVILLSLMVLITVNDILRLVRR